MIQLRTRDAWWHFRPVLEERDEFKTYGALHGGLQFIPMHMYDPCDCQGKPLGSLDEKYRISAHHASYVVWSYDTPIAWYDPELKMWITPDEKYSITTSRHQGKIFTAISRIGN